MNNNDYIQKHSDILSFRELADGTIATYISYLRIFLDWVTSELGGKPVPDVSWEEILNITVRQSRQSGVARATCPD